RQKSSLSRKISLERHSATNKYGWNTSNFSVLLVRRGETTMRKSATKLPQDLGLLDSVLLGIGFIIGSGIFLFPILMAGKAGTFSLLSWVIGGVYTILTGLCFAENASRNPKAGGPYSFAHDSFGNLVGFMTGWTFWIGYV